MPPRQIYIEPAGPRSRAPKGVFASTYETMTSPENASVVRSVAIFGVRPWVNGIASCAQFTDLAILRIGRCRFPRESVRRVPPASVRFIYPTVTQLSISPNFSSS